MFVAAAQRLGVSPRVVSHAELLDAPEALLEAAPDGPVAVRIESFGGSGAPELTERFLALGMDAAEASGCQVVQPRRPERGEVLAPRQRHLGVRRYLNRLEALFDERPAWRLLTPPEGIKALFDKRVTSARYAGLGIPVPDRLPHEVTTPEALREAADAQGWRRTAIKLSCGSSASGLAVLTRRALVTTLHRRGDRWFNGHKLRRIRDRAEADRVLAFLLSEGSQVERFVPKATVDGAFMDLRVLVVDGQAVFTVVRQSRHAVTNLHLGGWRGDLAKTRALVGDDDWAQAMASCEAVWRAHDCFQVGVDVMFEHGFDGHRILEANAFGDLLPGLERDGLDVYGWQVRRMLETS